MSENSPDPPGKKARKDAETPTESGRIIRDPRINPDAPAFDFEELSRGAKTVYIRLGGTVYELKRTRSGRLVLHK